ncbi:DUF2628 domain-containing protein [Jiella sp. M17.18]|uniref:DUF2628 domain-containing protein n=1 Tax=Jiella sp. M17.18 TaxID=3234247 RepID=UPI0034DF9760
MSLVRHVVLEPPEEPGRSSRALFVRDRFSIWAFFFTFLWLFRYGLWNAGLIVLALALCIGIFAEIDGLGVTAAILSLLLGIYVALEGPMLRARHLRRRGWRVAAAFQASGRTEAELLYYNRPAEPPRLPPQQKPAPWYSPSRTEPRAGNDQFLGISPAE